MKKLMLSLALFLGGLGFSVVAQAIPASPRLRQASSSMKQGSSSQRDANLTIEGEITRVDDQQNVFWLQIPDGREMQFSFAKDTPITGSSSSIQGLRTTIEKGMHVKVQ